MLIFLFLWQRLEFAICFVRAQLPPLYPLQPTLSSIGQSNFCFSCLLFCFCSSHSIFHTIDVGFGIACNVILLTVLTFDLYVLISWQQGLCYSLLLRFSCHSCYYCVCFQWFLRFVWLCLPCGIFLWLECVCLLAFYAFNNKKSNFSFNVTDTLCVM